MAYSLAKHMHSATASETMVVSPVFTTPYYSQVANTKSHDHLVVALFFVTAP